MEIELPADGRDIGNAKAIRAKGASTGMFMSRDAEARSALNADLRKSIRVEIQIEIRPRNPKANQLPTEGYGLEVDGKVKSQYDTAEAATEIGLELKRTHPQIQVKVFSAKDGTRTILETPAVLTSPA